MPSESAITKGPKFADFYILGDKLEVSNKENKENKIASIIYDCVHKASGEERSVKVWVQPSNNVSHGPTSTKEETILKVCRDHPNLLHWKDSFQETHKDNDTHHMVTECLDYPNVSEVLEELMATDKYDKDKADAYRMKRVCEVIRLVVKGLAFLHSKHIYHGDIGPTSVLVRPVRNGDHPFENIMLVNFEKARTLKNAKDKATKLDLWDLGVMTFELLTGHPPFASLEDQKKPIANWYNITDPSCQDFIQKLLSPNPDNGPDSAVDINHDDMQVPWFKEMYWTPVDFAEGDKITQRIYKLRKMNRLEAAVHSYISNNLLLQQELDLWGQIFRYSDMDSDGVLDMEEFKTHMQDFYGYVSPDELREIFKVMDINRNGVISYSEFITFAELRHKKLETPKLKAAFQAFDVSQTGYITSEDLQAFFRHHETKGVARKNAKGGLSAKKAQAMIDKADKDGDGTLDFDEFCSMLLTKIERKKMIDEKYKVHHDGKSDEQRRLVENAIKEKKNSFFYQLF